MAETKRLEIPIEVLQDVFFEAMLAGWVSGATPVNLPELPGARQFCFKEENKYGNIFVLDTYWTFRGSSVSFGFTNIYHNNDAVWYMRYGGEYHKDAIKTVKQALKEAYEQQKFFGGRGMISFAHRQKWYHNNPVSGSDFTSFSGRESVEFVGIDISLGYHDYSGGLLLAP
ncbi:MAG: DUF5680 domain-containing protein [Patescibacteria group bacterium]